jgi:hypothetical protein
MPRTKASVSDSLKVLQQALTSVEENTRLQAAKDLLSFEQAVMEQQSKTSVQKLADARQTIADLKQKLIDQTEMQERLEMLTSRVTELESHNTSLRNLLTNAEEDKKAQAAKTVEQVGTLVKLVLTETGVQIDSNTLLTIVKKVNANDLPFLQKLADKANVPLQTFHRSANSVTSTNTEALVNSLEKNQNPDYCKLIETVLKAREIDGQAAISQKRKEREKQIENSLIAKTAAIRATLASDYRESVESAQTAARTVQP